MAKKSIAKNVKVKPAPKKTTANMGYGNGGVKKRK